VKPPSRSSTKPTRTATDSAKRPAPPLHTGPLVHGFHAVEAFLKRTENAISALFFAENRQDERIRACLSKAHERGVRCQGIASELLEAMTGTHRHQGIVAELSACLPQVHLDDVLEDLRPDALFLVLDGVQDPHNLGACLRVADAAGVCAVIAPKDRAAGLNATAMKVASGAASTVPYVVVTNLARALRALKEAGVWIVGAAGDAEKSLYAVRHEGPMAWVLGSEADGLRRLTRDTCDELACIPMQGTVESLNVSVATGLCLFETRRVQALGQTATALP
jgi:23S rRNA (guanosine2251-2'-O)-methyltransferase